jgi:hypothetical protein
MTVVSFSDHIDIVSLLEKLADASPNDSMIVSEENPDLG